MVRGTTETERCNNFNSSGKLRKEPIHVHVHSLSHIHTHAYMNIYATIPTFDVHIQWLRRMLCCEMIKLKWENKNHRQIEEWTQSKRREEKISRFVAECMLSMRDQHTFYRNETCEFFMVFVCVRVRSTQLWLRCIYGLYGACIWRVRVYLWNRTKNMMVKVATTITADECWCEFIEFATSNSIV